MTAKKTTTEQPNQVQAPQQLKQSEQKAKKNDGVELGLYQRFASIKSLDIDEGTKLTEDTQEKLKELEAEVKAYKGKKSKITATAAIGQEVLKLYEGFPVPNEYVEIIKNAKQTERYLM